MDIRPLPPEEAAVRRYVEELCVPYHRDLAAAVEDHALAEDVDFLDEEVAFRLDQHDEETRRTWVAVDGVDETDDVDLAAGDGDLAGFVTTEVDAAPPVFDNPDRLIVGDLYVAEPHRGTGLASRLVERAAEHARETGCAELALDVDVDNVRAVAFYEKLGFETARRRMRLPADAL